MSDVRITVDIHDGPGDGSAGSPEAPISVEVLYDDGRLITTWCHTIETATAQVDFALRNGATFRARWVRDN